MTGSAKQSRAERETLDCFVASLLAMTGGAPPPPLRRHRRFEIARDLVEEAGRRQPTLVGADEEREVLGHVAVLDGRDADLFQRVGELRKLRIVVELGAVGEAAGPGEDRGDGVCRGLLALLVLAVVTGPGAG